MIAIATPLLSFKVYPMNAAEIPKNTKLKPTIIETNPIENIGNRMNIKPRTRKNIQAAF